MARALDLARRGSGLCSPNPIVGCVILDPRGEPVGEGWHEFTLRDHAEVLALAQAGNRARGGTAYVTLEPCNHTGRTGPCSEALVHAGIARVVAATCDPNPLVAGAGFATLRRAGVAVETGLLATEAQRLNDGFARWIQHHRPFVTLKIAMSLDGRIAPANHSAQSPRQPHWITSPASREVVHRMRHAADAVLSGIGTVLADDPLLTDRSRATRRRPLLRVVLDSALRLPLDSKLVATADNDLLLCTLSRDQARIRQLRDRGVRVEQFQPSNSTPADTRIPLDPVLALLAQENILNVLTEAGTSLNTALLTQNLVDRVEIFCAPLWLGAEATPAFASLPAPFPMSADEIERIGEDILLSTLLRDPWR